MNVKLPLEFGGRHFDPELIRCILYQCHHCQTTQPLLLEQLHEYGIDISTGQIEWILSKGHEPRNARGRACRWTGPRPTGRGSNTTIARLRQEIRDEQLLLATRTPVADSLEATVQARDKAEQALRDMRPEYQAREGQITDAKGTIRYLQSMLSDDRGRGEQTRGRWRLSVPRP